MRAASLIAGINRVACSFAKWRSTISRYGDRQFETRSRCAADRARDLCSTHFILRGYKVTFADLENLGQFDLLLDTPVGPFEVECKTITQDTSAQIKAELVASMSDLFHRTVTKKPPVAELGLFTLTLKKPVASCKDLPRQLALALQGKTPGAYHGADFSLQFSPRPEWQELLNSDRWPDLFRQISLI